MNEEARFSGLLYFKNVALQTVLVQLVRDPQRT